MILTAKRCFIKQLPRSDIWEARWRYYCVATAPNGDEYIWTSWRSTYTVAREELAYWKNECEQKRTYPLKECWVKL